MAPGSRSTSTASAPGSTNQPLGDAKDPSKRSRGELPLALARHETAAAAVDDVAGGVPARGLQRVVAARRATAPRCSSSTSPGGPSPAAVALAPGIHVLENRALGEPSRKVDLVRQALGNPADGDGVVAAFRGVLVDHRLPEGDDRPNAANCVHLDSFGTRSSCIVRVPAGPGPPRVWVADGPPCCDALRGGRRAVEARPCPDGLSPGRAACSAAGAAGRPRRRGACAGRPRSR